LLESGDYGDIPGLRFSTQHWTSLLDLFELDEATALKLGGRNFDLIGEGAEGPEISPDLILPTEMIPDRLVLEDASNLVGKFFFDQKIGRRFGYLKPELELYQRLKIAPPRRHPRGRIMEICAKLNKPEFLSVRCQKCDKVIRVAKNFGFSDRRINCRGCYLKFLEKNN
jgi:ribosomal protein S27E